MKILTLINVRQLQRLCQIQPYIKPAPKRDLKKYKCKQYNDLNPPNVAGKWDRTNHFVLVHNDSEEVVSFKNMIRIDDDIVTITQCGVFVIFETEPHIRRPIAIDRLGMVQYLGTQKNYQY
ncbi:Hypothetical protein HVR_LOCUS284 [uncultured virus]|nr:Hypothetical protein HVR_LOCUS284 [uncultured virus]